MTGKKGLGSWGERQAAEYLARQGYAILESNVHSPYGEIDLVAQCQGVTVFVEVKTRTSTRFGYPEEAITPRKLEHLLASAQAYLQSHPELAGDWRIDAIAIEKSHLDQPPHIVHFENVLNRAV